MKKFIVADLKFGKERPVAVASFNTMYEAVKYIDESRLFGFGNNDYRILTALDWQILLHKTWKI